LVLNAAAARSEASGFRPDMELGNAARGLGGGSESEDAPLRGHLDI
jgi:hypothetical protein